MKKKLKGLEHEPSESPGCSFTLLSAGFHYTIVMCREEHMRKAMLPDNFNELSQRKLRRAHPGEEKRCCSHQAYRLTIPFRRHSCGGSQ